MNIDKQIEKIIIDNTKISNYPKLVGTLKTNAVSQIKQSILKAIMEGKPVYKEDKFFGLGEFEYIYRKIYRQAIKEFESVIKEILSK